MAKKAIMFSIVFFWLYKGSSNALCIRFLTFLSGVCLLLGLPKSFAEHSHRGVKEIHGKAFLRPLCLVFFLARYC